MTHCRLEGMSQAPYTFDTDGGLYKNPPYLWALSSYAEVAEGFASQDPNVYPITPTDTFIMPVDRYPRTVYANESSPKSAAS